MELLYNQNVVNCLSMLGLKIGDKYKPSDKCLEILKEIYMKLMMEDKMSRSFRRALYFSRGFENDLIPLLLQTDDPEVVEAIIRILACLLIPVECLLPVELSQSHAAQITVFELKSFLTQCKNLFCDQRTTLVILEFLKSVVQSNDNSPFSKESCESINNSLLVFRNVLHLPDSQKNLQNVILRNLFVQNVDQILLHLMIHKNKEFWSVAIVQLVAVMYKDQHVGSLQKLLQIWFERSLSESSEDNESNTTRDPGNTSSSFATSSDPSSDSSESGAVNITDQIRNHPVAPRPHMVHHSPIEKMVVESECGVEKYMKVDMMGRRQRVEHHVIVNTPATKIIQHNRFRNKSYAEHKKISELTAAADLTHDISSEAQDFSDFGYSSHVDTPENISTSSKEDESSPPKRPFHQKPNIQKTRYSNKQPSPQEKKEARRKIVLRRRKNTLKNKNMVANHNPRDEDITNMLAEFTMDFLTAGYEPLVSTLLKELLTPTCGLPLDTSHFFWLLTYFLKFVGQLELNMDQVRGVLSFRVLGYLVYQGVYISDQIERTLCEHADVASLTRRQHLVVTAIREFILSLEAYSKVTHLSLQDKEELRKLQGVIVACKDLRCLLVLMLRLFRSDVQSRQYLEDLVVTNHILLIFLEHHQEVPSDEFSLPEHIQQFAKPEMMQNYGMVLENFKSNGEFLNDCVLTMMHHVGGEMNQVVCLYQPNILKTFTKIWESDVQLCEDWSDLIEFVIHQFVDYSNCSSDACILLKPGLPSKGTASKIDCNITKSISSEIKCPENTSAAQTSKINTAFAAQDMFKVPLNWLRQCLLDARRTKLAAQDLTTLDNILDTHPVSYHYTIMNEPIPMVTWDFEIEKELNNQSLKSFILRLGFERPRGSSFYHIPSSWTSDDLHAIAQKLVSVDSGVLCQTKVSSAPSFTEISSVQPFIMPRAKNTTSIVNQTPVPNLPTSWLNVVKKSKKVPPVINIETATNVPELASHSVNKTVIIEMPHNFSIGAKFEIDLDVHKGDVVTNIDSIRCREKLDEIECASIVSLCETRSSEITHMCISDEDDRN